MTLHVSVAPSRSLPSRSLPSLASLPLNSSQLFADQTLSGSFGWGWGGQRCIRVGWLDWPNARFIAPIRNIELSQALWHMQKYARAGNLAGVILMRCVE